MAVNHRIRQWIALAAWHAVVVAANAAEVSFVDDVEPILRARCQVCHGEAQQLSGLRLDSREATLKGGYSGPVVVPGSSERSRLFHLVVGDGELRMPPAGPELSPAEIALLRDWIDQGATGPEGAAPPQAVPARTSDHWSFQPVSRQPPPAVQDASWIRNDIDRFVLSRLENEGVTPSDEAPRETLLRRVSLDLTGLPPSPREIERFLADDSPAAYERAIDRLLESPHFGERWATPWLDLVRYADSDGYEKDTVRPFAWRYRDWVINALNDDKPFDEFTVEQIAGDLLDDATQEQLIATGFHRQTLKNREGGVKLEQFRFEETIDRTNTVSTVWLGLTTGCAQCHDHKYDPISQKEYYQLFAYFNQLDEADIDAPRPGEMGPYLSGLPEYRERRRELLEKNRVLELQPAWEARMKEAAANPGKWTDWDHAYDALQKYLDGSERTLNKPPEERTEKEQEKFTDHFIHNYHRVITKDFRKELDWGALQKELRSLRDDFPALAEAPVIEQTAEERATHIHLRGDWQSLGIPVEPGTLAVLPALEPDEEASRKALAEWLVSPENPLTARVTVNRIWQEYFGEGLVATPEDFGTRAEKPEYMALLDWLARELMDNDWLLKQLHKTIVMSATYRQSSVDRPDLRSLDPKNRLLARQVRLRLPAELIRDAALHASGLLYAAVGGASVRPPLPDGVTALGYANSLSWRESTGRDRYRRGLYIHFQRTAPYPQLIGFDASERAVTECQRERSNTPLQALNLLNDPVFVEAARALAVRVLASEGDFEDQLDYAYRLSLSRSPTPDEVEIATDYYSRQVDIFEKDAAAAAAFMPVEIPGAPRPKAAAWAGLGSVILNLDEFITRE